MFKCLKEIAPEKPVIVEESEQDDKKVLKLVLIIAGGILVAAGIAFLVYKLIERYGIRPADRRYGTVCFQIEHVIFGVQTAAEFTDIGTAVVVDICEIDAFRIKAGKSFVPSDAAGEFIYSQVSQTLQDRKLTVHRCLKSL